MRHHLVVSELFVEGAAVVPQQCVGLDMLHIGPRALVGFIAVFIVHFNLHHKQRQGS